MKRTGRNARLYLFLLQGTLRDKPFRKGKGARDIREAMPSCAFLLDFLEKKEDKKQRKQGKKKGRNARLCPRNVVGETF